MYLMVLLCMYWVSSRPAATGFVRHVLKEPVKSQEDGYKYFNLEGREGDRVCVLLRVW